MVLSPSHTKMQFYGQIEGGGRTEVSMGTQILVKMCMWVLSNTNWSIEASQYITNKPTCLAGSV